MGRATTLPPLVLHGVDDEMYKELASTTGAMSLTSLPLWQSELSCQQSPSEGSPTSSPPAASASLRQKAKGRASMTARRDLLYAELAAATGALSVDLFAEDDRELHLRSRSASPCRLCAVEHPSTWRPASRPDSDAEPEWDSEAEASLLAGPMIQPRLTETRFELDEAEDEPRRLELAAVAEALRRRAAAADRL